MEVALQTILKKSKLENWYIVRDMFSSEECQKLERDVVSLPNKKPVLYTKKAGMTIELVIYDGYPNFPNQIGNGCIKGCGNGLI